MNVSMIPADARAGRFTRRVSFFEEPTIAERVDEIAAAAGTSSAAIIRTAVRGYLERVDPAPRRGTRVG